MFMGILGSVSSDLCKINFELLYYILEADTNHLLFTRKYYFKESQS